MPMPAFFLRASCDAGRSANDAMKAAAEIKYGFDATLGVDRQPLENRPQLLYLYPAPETPDTAEKAALRVFLLSDAPKPLIAAYGFIVELNANHLVAQAAPHVFQARVIGSGRMFPTIRP